MDWVKQLHAELADATILVWKMQNALSESGDRMDVSEEIGVLAAKLQYRTDVVSGHVARWRLYEATQLFDRLRARSGDGKKDAV